MPYFNLALFPQQIAGLDSFIAKDWSRKPGEMHTIFFPPPDSRSTTHTTCELLLVLPDRRLAMILFTTGTYSYSRYTLELWDPVAPRCEHILKQYNSSSPFDKPTIMVLLANGWLAVSGFDNNLIELFDPVAGVLKGRLECDKSSERVFALAALPDGSLASGHLKTIKLWNIVTLQCVRTLDGIFQGHSKPVRSLAVLRDGRLASGSEDGKIKVWNMATANCEHTLQSNYVSTLTVLPDGRLESLYYDDSIKLWNTASWNFESFSERHSSKTALLLPLRMGEFISTVGQSITIRLSQESPLTNLEVLKILNLFWEHLQGASSPLKLKTLDLSNIPLNNYTCEALERLLRLPGFKLQELKLDNTNLSEDNINKVFRLFLRRKESEIPSEAPSPKPASQGWGTWGFSLLSTALNTAASAVSGALTPVSTVDQGIESSSSSSSSSAEPLDRGMEGLRVSINIPYRELKFGKELGSGSFGKVFKGTYQGKEVAIKTLLQQNITEDVLDEFKTEAVIMAKLRASEYIVKLEGVCLEVGHYSLVMEYMPLGSLYHVIQGVNQGDFSWKARVSLAADIAHGMLALDKKHIIHGDLKSLNVLVKQVGRDLRAKIADFGMSKVKISSSASTLFGPTAGGSTRWMAPEVLKNESGNTNSSDVYSLGRVLQELATLTLPFAKTIPRQEAFMMAVAMDQLEVKLGEELPRTTSQRVAHLISWCCKTDPKARPKIQQVAERLDQQYASYTG